MMSAMAFSGGGHVFTLLESVGAPFTLWGWFPGLGVIAVWLGVGELLIAGPRLFSGLLLLAHYIGVIFVILHPDPYGTWPELITQGPELILPLIAFYLAGQVVSIGLLVRPPPTALTFTGSRPAQADG